MINQQPVKQHTSRVVQKKSFVKEFLEMVAIVSTIATIFSAGFLFDEYLLQINHQEKVIIGASIPKSELASYCVLRKDAVFAIEQLIDSGQSLNNDSNKRIWLSEVLAFIHGIELEKDFEWRGQKVSAIEADIRYAFEDPNIDVQVYKTLGILKGFRAAIQTRILVP